MGRILEGAVGVALGAVLWGVVLLITLAIWNDVGLGGVVTIAGGAAVFYLREHNKGIARLEQRVERLQIELHKHTH